MKEKNKFNSKLSVIEFYSHIPHAGSIFLGLLVVVFSFLLREEVFETDYSCSLNQKKCIAIFHFKNGKKLFCGKDSGSIIDLAVKTNFISNKCVDAFRDAAVFPLPDAIQTSGDIATAVSPFPNAIQINKNCKINPKKISLPLRLLMGKGVNINKDNAKDFAYLPGIGPVKAKKIINYRNKNGPFKSAFDLTFVKGIGMGTLERLENWIED